MNKRLIYAEDAINAVAKGLKGVFVEYQDVAEKLLNNVPSVQPEPPEDICGECDAWNKYKSEIKALPSAQLGQRYTNEELMIFQHGISLSLLSKRSAQHWRYDENTATEIKFLERLYEKVSANMRGGQNG